MREKGIEGVLVGLVSLILVCVVMYGMHQVYVEFTSTFVKVTNTLTVGKNGAI